MILKRFSKNRLGKAVFGCLFAIISLFSLASLPMNKVYAEEPVEQGAVHIELNTSEEADNGAADDGAKKSEEEGEKNNKISSAEEQEACRQALGNLGWFVCPGTNATTKAVDWLYERIEGVLTIDPVEMKDGKPIYEIWKYMLGVTNIVFIIFLLVVVYSQLTGLGISNYGVKKALPKIIVVAILMNLSFLICSVLVDVSNIIGDGLRGVFASIEERTMSNFSLDGDVFQSIAELQRTLDTVKVGSILGAALAFESGAIWMLIPVVLGALVAVTSGLITIALRQAVVVLLIMIAPLAFVAYMLPNAEQWFRKWKQLFIKMLIFYPMFSLLFGASNLAGWAIMSSATDWFGLLLGVAVQIFPLFFSWNLMTMSGTILGAVNARMRSMAARPLASNRAWASSRRENRRLNTLANGTTPSARLRQFVYSRRVQREEETKEYETTAKNRALAYVADKNRRRNRTPSREGERAYEMQARNMEYERRILRNKSNMNKGLGQLEAVKRSTDFAQRERLNRLDIENVNAADALAAERTRAEKIDYDNALGRAERFDNAMKAHMDNRNGYDFRNGEERADYKFHYDNRSKEYSEAIRRYSMIKDTMENNLQDTHYIVADAAHAYDANKKILEGKMQKYFDQTVPTKDIEYRLDELSRDASALKNIDMIIPGLRILNQRGDTDLVKHQLDNLLDHGLKGGTRASQAIASFLMFEVKDKDPFLRRFGKYINLQTAKIYNENKRKLEEISFDEYVKGEYMDADGSIVKTGKNILDLIQGTSLDGVERTAFGNLDESLMKVYGYKGDGTKWDVEEYLNKKDQIMNAIKPSFYSAESKWASGSEQMNSGVKFWMGCSALDGSDGVWATFDDDDKEKVEEFYRKKAKEYVSDKTLSQIQNMRTDFRDSLFYHLDHDFNKENVEYRDDYERYKKGLDKIKDEYIDKYKLENPTISEAEINEKLGKDSDYKEAIKKHEYKYRYGVPYRRLLAKGPKLKRLYETRRSGGSSAMKDWNNMATLLSDEKELAHEIDRLYKDDNSDDANYGGDGDYDKLDPNSSIRQEMDLNTGELDKIFNNNGGVAMNPRDFYNKTMKFLDKFDKGLHPIKTEFNKFYDANRKNITTYSLYEKAMQLLKTSDYYK